MKTTTQLPAGGTIDVSGWPPPGPSGAIPTPTHVRAGQGGTIDPDG